MERPECRYCGIEIEGSWHDLPQGVISLGNSLAHDACVFADHSELPSDSSYVIAERHYQQARARGAISAG